MKNGGVYYCFHHMSHYSQGFQMTLQRDNPQISAGLAINTSTDCLDRLTGTTLHHWTITVGAIAFPWRPQHAGIIFEAMEKSTMVQSYL
jgi:hypothetical protein